MKINALQVLQAAGTLCFALLLNSPVAIADYNVTERLNALRSWEAALQSVPDSDEINTTLKLVDSYLTGRGRERDVSTGIALAEDLADMGVPHAKYSLGWAHANPELGHLDYEQSVIFLRRATVQGYAPAYVDLGIRYFRGEGVEKNAETAVKYFKKACDEVIAYGCHMLGFAYDTGKGVQQDYKQAVKWYRKAAEQGYDNAQYNLGIMYLNGTGIAKDNAQAVNWFRKAAEQGYLNAQYNLGIMYKDGTGVPQDPVLAHMWLNMAALQGDEKAAGSLETLSDNMTPQQISEAQTIYRERIANNR